MSTIKKISEEDKFLERLEKWVEEHSESADVQHINLTTGKEFTIREILHQLRREKETGVMIADKDFLDIAEQVKKWLAG